MTSLATKWKTYKLDELGSVARGKSKHRPRNDPSLYDGIYPFFQTGDIKAANLYLTEYSQTYNEKGLAQSKLWQPGTLCITISANIADTAILGIPGCFPDSIVGFVPDKSKSDVRFIKYYIDVIKLQMQSISRGTTQDNLSVDKLLTFDFLVPQLNYQNKIADVLSTYDNLIENNIRRIQILEQMSQAIYAEWFVNYRFPNHEKVKMIDSGTDFGKIPAGWKVENLSGLVDFVRGVEPGSDNYRPEYQAGRIPFLRVGDLGSRSSNIFVDSNIVGDNLINKADIAVTMDGTVGRVAIGFYGAYSTGIRKLVIKNEIINREYLYLLMLSDLIQGIIKSHAKGTTILHASESIKYMRFVLPSKKVMDEICILVKPLIDGILVLREQNKNLATARNLLTPKLVTGEVKI